MKEAMLFHVLKNVVGIKQLKQTYLNMDMNTHLNQKK